MKKFIIVCLVGGLLTSCGTKKNIVVAHTNTKKVHPRPTRAISKVQREVKVIKEKPRKEEAKVRPASSYQEKVTQYITTYAAVAKNEMKQYGIPASITLAQGILESGAGYGTLTQKSKNHFGIKCHDWAGGKVYHDDDVSQECFRKYEDPGQSFRDHSVFLAGRKRYAGLFKLPKQDYKAWAMGLKAAGYATDPKYPVKLIRIIEQYDLSKYDQEVMTGVAHTSKVKVEVPAPRVVSETSDAEGPIEMDLDASYKVKKGDTLYSISRKHALSVAQLKALNDLKNNNIQIGQVLKVSETEEFDF